MAIDSVLIRCGFSVASPHNPITSPSWRRHARWVDCEKRRLANTHWARSKPQRRWRCSGKSFCCCQAARPLSHCLCTGTIIYRDDCAMSDRQTQKPQSLALGTSPQLTVQMTFAEIDSDFFLQFSCAELLVFYLRPARASSGSRRPDSTQCHKMSGLSYWSFRLTNVASL